MNTYSRLFLVISSVFFISCNSDDGNSGPVISDRDFVNGALVLNEGGFSGGASVSFISEDLSEVSNSIFEIANEGEGIGVFPQSIFFEDDKAYIISNQSNLISVVNRFNFELIDVVDSGLNRPRYGTVLNGKAYVTNQADFETDQDDFIAVVDLQTLEVVESIATGVIVEHIVESGGQIFIQNAAFGLGNQISKLDPSSNSINQTLEVDAKLNSLEVYNDKLYALDSVGVKIIDPTAFAIENEIDKPESVESFSNLKIENNQLYYTLGTAAYSSSITASMLSDEVLFDYGSSSAFGSFYGFGVNEDKIYVGDAGDFTANGTVYIYSTSGLLLSEVSVGGIGPNNFYFQ